MVGRRISGLYSGKMFTGKITKCEAHWKGDPGVFNLWVELDHGILVNSGGIESRRTRIAIPGFDMNTGGKRHGYSSVYSNIVIGSELTKKSC